MVEIRASKQDVKEQSSQQYGDISERVIMDILRKGYSGFEMIKLHVILDDPFKFSKGEGGSDDLLSQGINVLYQRVEMMGVLRNLRMKAVTKGGEHKSRVHGIGRSNNIELGLRGHLRCV